MLRRRPDWQGVLDRFLAEHARVTFQYGSCDCCLFVCDAIEAMTGTDIAAPFRGGYGSRKEAMEAVKAYTGKPSVLAVAERVTSDYQMPMVNTAKLQRGDVSVFKRPRDYSLGIVMLNGSDSAVLTRGGILSVPVSTAMHGYRV